MSLSSLFRLELNRNNKIDKRQILCLFDLISFEKSFGSEKASERQISLTTAIRPTLTGQLNSTSRTINKFDHLFKKFQWVPLYRTIFFPLTPTVIIKN
ncbi:hypothetical protein BpHYR1_053295 [Brachionus plicatilis]|uniref:Uncharacterized protein n=1 Tax=Brachionus plicatilis TaxID=10195 RepID=A0A3M7Q7J1_BRAPC|nr:hypothetical protein BpHYR1_053295 [Brachionus plicatilis]